MQNAQTKKIGMALAMCMLVACATGGRKMTVWEIYDVRHPVSYQAQGQGGDNDATYTSPTTVGHCIPNDIATFSCE